MTSCSNCAAPLTENIKFCSGCGNAVESEASAPIESRLETTTANSCKSCGTTLPNGVRFCVVCGTAAESKVLAGTPGGVTVEVQTASNRRWYVTYATGQRGGPFTQDEVQGLIARQELKDHGLRSGGRWFCVGKGYAITLCPTYRRAGQFESARFEHMPSVRRCNDCGPAEVHSLESDAHPGGVDAGGIWLWSDLSFGRSNYWPKSASPI